MSKAEATEVFNCTPEEFFSIISDYNSYGDFLNEVSSCQIVEDKGNEKIVEYKVKVLKTFTYRLLMKEIPSKEITWTFHSGDLFKISNGSWHLAETSDGKTSAVYAVEAKFKLFVPGGVSKALLNVSLPNMMQAYHKQVKLRFPK